MTITVNGQSRASAEGITLAALLGELGLAGRPVVIELDGEPVTASAHHDTVIPAGARIEIVTLAAGG